MEKGMEKVARNMKLKGLAIADISEMTGLTEEQINQL